MVPALPIWSKSRPTSISSARQDRAGCAAGDDSLERLAVLDATGYLVDRLLQVVAHRQLVDAGALDVAADAEETRAAVALRADLRVGLATHQQDVRGTLAMVSALLMTVGPP